MTTPAREYTVRLKLDRSDFDQQADGAKEKAEEVKDALTSQPKDGTGKGFFSGLQDTLSSFEQSAFFKTAGGVVSDPNASVTQTLNQIAPGALAGAGAAATNLIPGLGPAIASTVGASLEKVLTRLFSRQNQIFQQAQGNVLNIAGRVGAAGGSLSEEEINELYGIFERSGKQQFELMDKVRSVLDKNQTGLQGLLSGTLRKGLDFVF